MFHDFSSEAINQVNAQGEHVLLKAIASGATEVVLHLIGHYPINPKIKCKNHYTALHLVAICGAETLMAPLLAYCKTTLNTVDFEQLINASARNGKTALQLAVSKQRGICVQALLSYTETKVISRKSDMPLLMLAAVNQDKVSFTALLQSVTLDVNTMGNQPYNTFHLLARTGNLEYYQLMKQHPSFDYICETQEGEQGLDIAFRYGNLDLLEQLIIDASIFSPNMRYVYHRPMQHYTFNIHKTFNINQKFQVSGVPPENTLFETIRKFEETTTWSYGKLSDLFSNIYTDERIETLIINYLQNPSQTSFTQDLARCTPFNFDDNEKQVVPLVIDAEGHPRPEDKQSILSRLLLTSLEQMIMMQSMGQCVGNDILGFCFANFYKHKTSPQNNHYYYHSHNQIFTRLSKTHFQTKMTGAFIFRVDPEKGTFFYLDQYGREPKNTLTLADLRQSAELPMYRYREDGSYAFTIDATGEEVVCLPYMLIESVRDLNIECIKNDEIQFKVSQTINIKSSTQLQYLGRSYPNLKQFRQPARLEKIQITPEDCWYLTDANGNDERVYLEHQPRVIPSRLPSPSASGSDNFWTLIGPDDIKSHQSLKSTVEDLIFLIHNEDCPQKALQEYKLALVKGYMPQFDRDTAKALEDYISRDPIANKKFQQLHDIVKQRSNRPLL